MELKKIIFSQQILRIERSTAFAIQLPVVAWQLTGENVFAQLWGFSNVYLPVLNEHRPAFIRAGRSVTFAYQKVKCSQKGVCECHPNVYHASKGDCAYDDVFTGIIAVQFHGKAQIVSSCNTKIETDVVQQFPDPPATCA